LSYASQYHEPVLCNTVIQGLVSRTDGIYVDGTLGGGGHTAALLDALDSSGRVVAIDRDDDAIRETSKRLSPDLASGRLTVLKGNFADVKLLLAEAGIAKVTGFLLDLGVSSHQIDEAGRGFSHRKDGPLDMRMDRSQGVDANELVNQLDVEELARLLRRFGEQPRSGRIARAIIRARPLSGTEDLSRLIRDLAPRGQEAKTLSRVFQAFRIAVNEELDALDRVLLDSEAIMEVGARLAVISYHSLEDRRVKRYMRSGNLEGEVQRDVFGNQITPWRMITRKPIMADEAEIRDNPRSRSARLRIVERLNDSESSR